MKYPISGKSLKRGGRGETERGEAEKGEGGGRRGGDFGELTLCISSLKFTIRRASAYVGLPLLVFFISV